MIRKSLLLGACLFLALPASAADNGAPAPEASARIIRVSAASGSPVHQSVTLGVGKSAVVELDTEGKRIAVLGEMRELGAESERGHREVGETAAMLGVNQLITIGDTAESMAKAARAAGSTSR